MAENNDPTQGMHVEKSIRGFIAGEPQLGQTSSGVPRFYARIGQEHYRHEGDGNFTKLPTTFHDMVLFRKSALAAFELFRFKDHFLAQGYTRNYTNAEGVEKEEFVAKTIGHNAVLTDYEVARKEPVSAEKSMTIAEALQAAQESTDRVVGTTDPAPAIPPRPPLPPQDVPAPVPAASAVARTTATGPAPMPERATPGMVL